MAPQIPAFAAAVAVRTPASTAIVVRRRPLRAMFLALAMLLGLCVPMVATAPAASAMTTLEWTYATAVRTMINAERALHGLPPLYGRARLVSSARYHNLKMASANLMSHQVPGEPGLGTRVTRTGYIWSTLGENIAWNSVISLSGVKTLQSLMYNEKYPYDGHRRNILSTRFQHVGVDVYIDKIHHKVWLTTDFGRH